MNDRISRVLSKMEEKGLTQLIVSDPLSIRFLTGIMVNPGERLYALILRTSGKHTMLLNYLYFVNKKVSSTLQPPSPHSWGNWGFLFMCFSCIIDL